MSDKRQPFTILGRIIGTATGWDQSELFGITLYDFVPIRGTELPRGSVNILFEQGRMESYSENGDVLASVDLVEALQHLPLVDKE